MSGPAAERADRVAAVIGAVARQALEDWGVNRVALLDDGSPEAELAAGILSRALGAERVVRVSGADPGVEPLLLSTADDPRAEALPGELRRLRARLVPDSLPAHPANKTALLLGGPLPPEPLLPLGDLYASEIAALVGHWSAPSPVRRLAEQAGGIERLDAALRRRLDARDPGGLGALGAELGQQVALQLARGAASRVAPHVVPKLGHRSLGADLFQ